MDSNALANKLNNYLNNKEENKDSSDIKEAKEEKINTTHNTFYVILCVVLDYMKSLILLAQIFIIGIGIMSILSLHINYVYAMCIGYTVNYLLEKIIKIYKKDV